jgi:hypothetical protein
VTIRRVQPNTEEGGPSFLQMPDDQDASSCVISRSEEIRIGEESFLISLISPRVTAAIAGQIHG